MLVFQATSTTGVVTKKSRSGVPSDLQEWIRRSGRLLERGRSSEDSVVLIAYLKTYFGKALMIHSFVQIKYPRLQQFPTVLWVKCFLPQPVLLYDWLTYVFTSHVIPLKYTFQLPPCLRKWLTKCLSSNGVFNCAIRWISSKRWNNGLNIPTVWLDRSTTIREAWHSEWSSTAEDRDPLSRRLSVCWCLLIARPVTRHHSWYILCAEHPRKHDPEHPWIPRPSGG